MKKLFLFATVAAAGLFAGCSSSDDAIADAGGSPIENVDGDKTPIKIGLGNVGETTRGTGTVGGVVDGSSNVVDGQFNVWAGQRINVFMFTKGALDNQGNVIAGREHETTLNLTNFAADPSVDPVDNPYYNTVMITPGSVENKIPGMEASVAMGEAMIEDGSIKYYPPTGNYDFFGYHLDDALPANTVTTDNQHIDKATEGQWSVPFEINGTQDLMSTKAELTGEAATPGTQSNIMSNATGHTLDYYSAYSARKGVQPVLSFKHLLTRLTFKVKAGNPAAAGWGVGYVLTGYKPKDGILASEYAAYASGTVKAATDLWEAEAAGTHAAKNVTITVDEYGQLANNDKALFEAQYVNGHNEDRAVKVDSIFIKSKTTGKLLVAWTGDKEDYQKIEWATTPVEKWLELKERPAYQLNAAATTSNADIDDTEFEKTDVAKHLVKLQAIKLALEGATTPDQAAIQAISDSIDVWNDKITIYKKSIIALTISEESYNLLTPAGQAKYSPLGSDNINADLVPLTSVAAQCEAPANYETSTLNSPCASPILAPVGEALLVAPNATSDGTAYTADEYEMIVKLSQMVPTNWNTPNELDYKTSYVYTELKWPTTGGTGAGAFKINHSYNVNVTVYGFNRIEVITEVQEWKDGGDIPVGQD